MAFQVFIINMLIDWLDSMRKCNANEQRMFLQS